MNVLSEDFLSKLRMAIVEVVKDAIKSLSKNEGDKRYLKQKQAREYIGGIDHAGFMQLINAGLPEIRIGGENEDSREVLRYDKKDIDEFMAKYKI